jgi:hypothetical protein
MIEYEDERRGEETEKVRASKEQSHRAHDTAPHLDHGCHELGQKSRDEKKTRPDLMYQVDDEPLDVRAVVVLNGAHGPTVT